MFQRAIAACAMGSDPYQTNKLINIQIKNDESYPVHYRCLAIDSNGEIITLHPARWDAAEEAARISKDESLVETQAEARGGQPPRADRHFAGLLWVAFSAAALSRC